MEFSPGLALGLALDNQGGWRERESHTNGSQKLLLSIRNEKGNGADVGSKWKSLSYICFWWTCSVLMWITNQAPLCCFTRSCFLCYMHCDLTQLYASTHWLYMQFPVCRLVSSTWRNFFMNLLILPSNLAKCFRIGSQHGSIYISKMKPTHTILNPDSATVCQFCFVFKCGLICNSHKISISLFLFAFSPLYLVWNITIISVKHKIQKCHWN